MIPALIAAAGSIGAAAAAPAPAAPSGAQSDNVFDASGWTVATGGSNAGAGLDWRLVGAGLAAATLVLVLWIKRK